VRSPKKKRSRKIKEIKHIDLFATSKRNTADGFPPIKSNDSTNVYDPPGIAWKAGAVRLLHVLVRLLSQIKESSALGGISVDWMAIQQAQTKAIHDAEANNSASKAWHINNRNDRDEPLSDSVMHELDKKYKVTETVFITPFVIQSIAKLGMVDTKSVTDQEGDGHAEFMEPQDVLSSLLTWEDDYSYRWSLYSALQVVESMKKKRELKSLRSLIKTKFGTPDKDELLSIINCITKREV